MILTFNNNYILSMVRYLLQKKRRISEMKILPQSMNDIEKISKCVYAYTIVSKIDTNKKKRFFFKKREKTISFFKTALKCKDKQSFRLLLAK